MLLTLKGYPVGGRVQDMEFPEGLRKWNVETLEVNKKEVEFPDIIKKKIV